MKTTSRMSIKDRIRNVWCYENFYMRLQVSQLGELSWIRLVAWREATGEIITFIKKSKKTLKAYHTEWLDNQYKKLNEKRNGSICFA